MRIIATRRLTVSLALVAACLVAGGVALAWRPTMPPREAAGVQFPPNQVAAGAELAAIGDCAICHTAAHGRPFAGGRGVPTPFGTVYATNITPDAETGIGLWSAAAFRRAMRDGVGRTGEHLYPVLPYPHFTRASDADIDALYAYLMTRAPVSHAAPANALPFPLNIRATLAGWNLLFLHPGAWTPDPAHDPAWNRGAYLVEAVGHCGACHTPRNVLGAEHAAERYAGGQAEGWHAPALQLDTPAREPWTADALATYLRTGFQSAHGAAAGPMTAVTDSLGAVPESDIRAMAVYVASLMPPVAVRRPEDRGSTTPPTALAALSATDPVTSATFDGACGACHAASAPMTQAGAPSLALGTALNAPTPQGVIQIILNGIPWREGRPGPYMPAFADALTDRQVEALTGYLRAAYTSKPAWADLAGAVRKARGDAS